MVAGATPGADGTAAAFLPRNIAIISLKYRTAPPSTDVAAEALANGKRAIRLVREHAGEWGIDPDKIGMIGWSAGANLALNVASRFDAGAHDAADPVERRSRRPDFVVLLSPWPANHTASDYPIPPGAPPGFIGSADDDKTAPADFTIDAPGEGGK